MPRSQNVSFRSRQPHLKEPGTHQAINTQNTQPGTFQQANTHSLGVLVPELFCFGVFLTSFTDSVSDTNLLHNEDLNCKQSKISKAEQTALIIFFKYCYVGIKVFGSHNAFFYCLKHEWVQRNSSTMRTIQYLFHRDTNALSEQTLLSTFTNAEVGEEPSLQTHLQPTAATTIILPRRNQLKRNKTNPCLYIYTHTK